MLISTHGIILHSSDYRESSLIVKIYTEACGVQSFIVNGVRSSKTRTGKGIFQPLNLLEMVFYKKPAGGLQRIKEITNKPAYTSIPFNTAKSATALFLAEVLYRSLHEEEENKKLFSFISGALQHYDSAAVAIPHFHLVFMMQLSRHLGFFPHGKFTEQAIFDMKEGIFTSSAPVHPYTLDHSASKLFFSLMNTGIESMSETAFTSSERKTLLGAMVTYYELHHTHGNTIRAHKVLEEVLY